MIIRTGLAIGLAFITLLATSSTGFTQDTGFTDNTGFTENTVGAQKKYDPLAGADLPPVAERKADVSKSADRVVQKPVANAQGPISPPATTQNGRLLTLDSATIVCEHKVQVAAQSDGLISELNVAEFDEVKKGDVLLRIDDRLAQADVAVAQVELDAAEEQAKQTAEVDYSIIASKVSQTEYEAEKELFDKGSSTFTQTNRKYLEAERARLGVDVAKVKHNKEMKEAEIAKAKLDAAKVRLGLYEVVAPYDGVIVQKMRDGGEWTRGGEPILRLVSLSEMKVEGYLPTENISLADIKGSPMQIFINTGSRTETLQSQVEFVSPEIDARRVRIGSRIKNVRLPNGAWLLSDGQNATIQVQVSGN